MEAAALQRQQLQQQQQQQQQIQAQQSMAAGAGPAASFREVVEAFAQTKGVLFIPKPGRQHEGKQVSFFFFFFSFSVGFFSSVGFFFFSFLVLF